MKKEGREISYPAFRPLINEGFFTPPHQSNTEYPPGRHMLFFFIWILLGIDDPHVIRLSSCQVWVRVRSLGGLSSMSGKDDYPREIGSVSGMVLCGMGEGERDPGNIFHY